MSNMGYCRFRNTLSDLQDCYDHMEEDFLMSEGEANARKRLIALCCDIYDEFAHEVGREEK